MPIFKKDKESLEDSSVTDGVEESEKKRFFGHKKEKNTKEVASPSEKQTNMSVEQEKEADAILDLIPESELRDKHDKNEGELDKSKKRMPLMKKDMRGKPVFLEDTGEKLGTVFDMIYDRKNALIGYKVKDNRSDAVLSFPIEQFDEDKSGLIFVPGWFTNAVKTVEKLEFKDRVSPELTALLSDDAVSNEELYEIFVKHDDEMAKYIEDAVSLKETISNRLRVLEKQRISMKEDLMDLTEKRLIKDIDRRQFSEDVMEHRRKVNILDVNINKCKELMKRLDNTSFGYIGKNSLVFDHQNKREGAIYSRKPDMEFKEEYDELPDNGVEQPYKNKYYALKEEFDQLEEDYQELKIAVDKLFNKNSE